MMNETTVSGDEFQNLANAISEVLASAINAGMSPDAAVCVGVQVCADYARGHYGNCYLGALAEVVVSRGSKPMPLEKMVN